MPRTSLVDVLESRIARIWRRLENRLVRAESRAHIRKLKQCGNGSAIWGRVSITGHSEISLGSNVHIGGGAHIRGEGGLRIGDNTHISRNIVLYTINHRYEGVRLPYDEMQVSKPVEIGRNVWIGMNVKVAPGTSIGDGAIVAMGAVVSGNIPPMAIVGSQPWRVLGYRDVERYDHLDQLHQYGGPSGRPLGNRATSIAERI